MSPGLGRRGDTTQIVKSKCGLEGLKCSKPKECVGKVKILKENYKN